VEEQRMRRSDFLRAGAMAAGTAALVACGVDEEKPSATGTTTTKVSHPPIEQEPGTLRVFEWAGYEIKPLWRPYAKQFPDEKPKFSFLTSDDQALSKVRAGFRADIVHPCVGYVQDWVRLGAIQPFDPALISNYDDLNPSMLKSGQVDGKQYFIPADWGFSAPLYRADKVEPQEESWSLLYDERYSGKISWWDSMENLTIVGYVRGFENPWDMTDDELEEAKSFLISKKKVVRTLWATSTDLYNDFGSGNVWIAYAWPDNYVDAKSKGLDVVYPEPTEGRLSWVCGFVLAKDTESYRHAHAFVDAWSSARTGRWLLDNYYYGHANTTVDLEGIDPSLVESFHLGDPSALEEPKAHIDRYVPRRQVYNQVWEEVKAA
jgi:spermidine/putrescine transport system substrate-binding protein